MTFSPQIRSLSPRLLSLGAALPRWATRFLVLVICWQLAGLFWAVFAPSTENAGLVMPPSGGAQASLGKDSLLAWYGTESRAAATDTVGDYQLIAVIAGPKGAAIFRDGSGKPLVARSGDDFAPGIRLLAVEPMQALIERAGAKKTLSLVQNTKTLDIRLTEPKAAATASPPIPLTRGQMLATMQGNNLARWDKGFSALPEGGIRVENADSQPLVKMLRLKNGDILKSINRQTLDKLADISLLLHAISQQPRIDLVLVRNGNSMTQRYDIKP